MKKLLTLKELSAIDKLLILTIQVNTIFEECRLTSIELATSVGLSKKIILNSIQKLEELNYITCKVDGKFRSRITKITERFNKLIK